MQSLWHFQFATMFRQLGQTLPSQGVSVLHSHQSESSSAHSSFRAATLLVSLAVGLFQFSYLTSSNFLTCKQKKLLQRVRFLTNVTSRFSLLTQQREDNLQFPHRKTFLLFATGNCHFPAWIQYTLCLHVEILNLKRKKRVFKVQYPTEPAGKPSSGDVADPVEHTGFSLSQWQLKEVVGYRWTERPTPKAKAAHRSSPTERGPAYCQASRVTTFWSSQHHLISRFLTMGTASLG